MIEDDNQESNEEEATQIKAWKQEAVSMHP